MALASIDLKPRHVVPGLDDADHKTMIYRMALKAAGPGAPGLAYIGRTQLGTGPVGQLLSAVPPRIALHLYSIMQSSDEPERKLAYKYFSKYGGKALENLSVWVLMVVKTADGQAYEDMMIDVFDTLAPFGLNAIRARRLGAENEPASKKARLAAPVAGPVENLLLEHVSEFIGPLPELAAVRRLLRIVLGDVASVPTAVSNVWTGSWAAPPGRRCCHGTLHEAPTTFETRVSHLHRCAAPRCAGTVGGSYWKTRTACSTCSAKHCATCQKADVAGHVCSAANVAAAAKSRLAADAMVYETCHACSSSPAVLGPLRLAIPVTAPPVSSDVYAPVIATQHPSWALRPRPVFTCYQHTFLALFTITDGGKLEHADDARRVLGITTESDVVLGVKRGAKPYAWASVAHWFREPLRAWFLREHAATAAMLPAPEERPPRPQLWTLPCCASVKPCGRKTCQTLTHEPWLNLRQLQAHGLLAETPAAGVETQKGGV